LTTLLRATSTAAETLLPNIWRAATAISCQRICIDTLEEPGPDEDPLIVDLGASVSEVAAEIIRLFGTSAMVRRGVAT
jgi:hypothetical protein